MNRPPYKVRRIAGRDRLDTGRVVIGIAHQSPPAPMGSEAERVSRALAPPLSHIRGMHGAMNPLRWPPRHPTRRSIFERLLARLRLR